jgi:tetratricopeptide (TPR) repeat protein
MAAIYNNIGWLYESKEDYTKALDYYRKSLEISRKTLPPTHHHVTEAENSIRRLKNRMKN